jgi:hypothetical protein
MIKRALEEWRRQRDQNNLDGHGMQQSHQPVPGYHVSPSVPSNSELENKLRMQDQQIAQLIEANRLKVSCYY